LNYLGVFYQLADAVLPSGGGIMRFEVVGSSQKLFFDDGTGEKLVAFAHNTLLTGPGQVGVRAVGAVGAVSYDDFSVSRAATPTVSLPDVQGGSVTDGFNAGGANQLGRQWIEGSGNFSADSFLTNSTNLAMASLRMAQKDVSVSAKVNVKAGD